MENENQDTLEFQISIYEELSSLTGLQMQALAGRDWPEVERLEETRSSLFREVLAVTELKLRSGAGFSEEDKKGRLLAAMQNFSKVGAELNEAVEKERMRLTEEAGRVKEGKAALKVYFSGRGRALLLDKKV